MIRLSESHLQPLAMSWKARLLMIESLGDQGALVLSPLLLQMRPMLLLRSWMERTFKAVPFGLTLHRSEPMAAGGDLVPVVEINAHHYSKLLILFVEFFALLLKEPSISRPLGLMIVSIYRKSMS